MMRVSAQVEQYDFSAHADREGVLAFLESYRDSKVLVNHATAVTRSPRNCAPTASSASAGTRGPTRNIIRTKSLTI